MEWSGMEWCGVQSMYTFVLYMRWYKASVSVFVFVFEFGVHESLFRCVCDLI